MTLKTKLILGAVVAAWCLGFGIWLGHKWAPAPVVVHEPGAVTRVEVPVDRIVEKTVAKWVKDPTEVNKLLAENSALRVSVQALTESLATYQSSGQGPVVVPPSNHQGLTFEDWRLKFASDGQKATYTLSQRFELLTTTGRREDGTKAVSVRLFEIGPGETRTPIPDLTTTAVLVDTSRRHWLTQLRIQGGLVVALDAQRAATSAGIGAFQWLVRGKTSAAEDCTFALLSPAVRLSASGPEVGLLPLSYNLGSLPKQPFKNLWISPYLGFSPSSRSLTRVGMALTASF